jgi:hypothetical protein
MRATDDRIYRIVVLNIYPNNPVHPVKKSLKTSLSVCFTCVLMMLLVTTAMGQQKSALEMMQQAYQTKQQELLSQYSKGLGATLDELKNKGDLDNFLIVETEKKRFEKEMIVPTPSEAKGSFRPVTLAHYRALASLQDQYIKALDGLIKKEVIAGRIDEAKVLRAEKDKVSTSLSELQAILPAPAETIIEKPKPKEASPEKLPAEITNALIVHYAFDGQDKTTVADKSGKGPDGMLHGATRVSRGTHGKACDFDGKNDYLVTRANLDLRGSTPWTLSVWFKAGKQPRPYDNIVSIGKSSFPRGVYGIGAGDDLRSLNINLWCAENYPVKIGVDISKAFVHAVVAYDGERAFIYINGLLKDDRRQQLSIMPSPAWIGGRTGGYEGQYFDGTIGDVMIFKRALTAPEVETLYNLQQ